MDKGLILFNEALSNNRRIGIYGDYDLDGCFAHLIVKEYLELLEYFNYISFYYNKRTHIVKGSIYSFVADNQIDLLFILDAGSSQEELLTYLVQSTKIILIDHHISNLGSIINHPNFAFINMLALYGDKSYSGGSLTFEFVRTHSISKGIEELVKSKLSFYGAVSLYADAMNDDNEHTREMYLLGSRCDLPSKFFFLTNYIFCKRYILFSVAPLINAAFRNQKLHIINSLFLSRETRNISEHYILVSQLEDIRTTSRNLMEELYNKVVVYNYGEFIVTDLSGFLNKSVNNQIISDNKGLIASRLAQEHNKCAIVIVAFTGGYKISVRDSKNRNILSHFESRFNVGGHPPAFGGIMSNTDILNLKDSLISISKKMVSQHSVNSVKDINILYPSDIRNMILSNEYKQSSKVELVRFRVCDLDQVYTPKEWGSVTLQFKLIICGRDVYVPCPASMVNYKFVDIELYSYGDKIKGEIRNATNNSN